jgi:hypothetical protein
VTVIAELVEVDLDIGGTDFDIGAAATEEAGFFGNMDA